MCKQKFIYITIESTTVYKPVYKAEYQYYEDGIESTSTDQIAN